MEENKDNNVKSTIDAITGLANAVPIYQDAVQPAAKEIGKSLATVTKTVNIALAPIKALVWGYEKIEVYLTKRVSEKLEGIPEENIITPPPHIAGPAVEALRFTGENENLRELYASLLAVSMNRDTTDKAHPSFVEIIKNLSSNEALILKEFINVNSIAKIDIEQKQTEGKITRAKNFTLLHKNTKIDVNNIPIYLDNLQRLGIIEIIRDQYFSDDSEYEILRSDIALRNLIKDIQSQNCEVDFKKGFIELTSFGRDFVRNVVAME
ncbi:MAG: DUF4393 domain-containing protein [Flavobacterium sp.]